MNAAALIDLLFARGHACDLVLLVMAAEFCVLALVRRQPLAAALALGPGALIVLALRAALTGQDWRWIALPLAVSLPLHLADLHRRGWLAPRRVTATRGQPTPG